MISPRQASGNLSIGFSRGPGPAFYKEVEILDHAPRPQGIYVRFRNRGNRPIAMARFKVRGYEWDKLWAEFEESAYSETQPTERDRRPAQYVTGGAAEQASTLCFRNAPGEFFVCSAGQFRISRATAS